MSRHAGKFTHSMRFHSKHMLKVYARVTMKIDLASLVLRPLPLFITSILLATWIQHRRVFFLEDNLLDVCHLPPTRKMICCAATQVSFGSSRRVVILAARKALIKIICRQLDWKMNHARDHNRFPSTQHTPTPDTQFDSYWSLFLFIITLNRFVIDPNKRWFGRLIGGKKLSEENYYNLII